MSYQARFNPMTSMVDYVKNIPISNIINVAVNGGADFTKLQDAINSVTGSFANQYAIMAAPGIYPENLTLKPFVHIIGTANGPGGPIITGLVTSNFTAPGDMAVLNRVNIMRTVASDGEICCNFTGSVPLIDCFVTVTCSNDYAFTAIKANLTTNFGAFVLLNLSTECTYDGSTKDITGIEVVGTQGFNMANCTVGVAVAASSGTIIARKISSTGELTFIPNNLKVTNTKSGFVGEVCGSRVLSTTTAFRISQGEQIRLKGAGTTGTAIGMCLNTSGNAGEMFYVDTVLFESGFAPTTMYSANTAVGDTQKIWLNSTNRDLPENGLGLAIITPHALIQTGFVGWSTVAGNYYSFVPATKTFTLLKRCTGIFHSAPVVCAANQSVVFPTKNTTYFVYSDSDGVLQYTATPDFENQILLFSVFNDGTYYSVTKQFHAAKFPAAVAEEWHTALGSSIQNDAGGIITLLSGAGKTLNLVGDTVYHDNGLDSTIKDSAGAAISMQMFYTGVSGTTIYSAAFTSIPAVYMVGTTVTAVPSGRYANYRIGVMPSNNIDDVAANTYAQYVIIPDTTTHANSSAAAAAIASDSVASFPTPVSKGLEAIMLGYVTIQGSATPITGGTLTAVTPKKAVFGTNFASGTSSSAATNLTDTTLFDKILSASDTSVQLALNTIDENASKKEVGDIPVTSFSAGNNQAVAADVTGLAFANASVRSFRASISIYVNATASLYESVYIYGIQRGADWVITTSSVGDDSGFVFTITSAGAVQYTNLNYSGFVAATLKFRAWCNPV